MNDRKELDELVYRLDTLLPAEYRDKAVEPVPMRSAGLKYADDGTVAWDQMWASFCVLAMAGGPPHKGALLRPGTPDAVAAKPTEYDAVVEEITRGIVLATDLQAGWSPDAGWIRVTCYSETMAAWLLRAITMENVSVRQHGRALNLPASPDFRLEKEIKNVITVVAKTSHYWLGHMPQTQKESIAILLASISRESPLLDPSIESAGAPAADAARLATRLSDGIFRETGLIPVPLRDPSWLGITCANVSGAVWLMRAAVAYNMLSRREGTTWFVPVNASSDANGDRVVATVSRLHRLARANGTL